MKSPRDTISLEGDCQYFILFAHEMTVLFAKNNVSCQPSILLVFSAGDLILPTVCFVKPLICWSRSGPTQYISRGCGIERHPQIVAYGQ
jgi:hypothetical protein